MSGFRSGDVLDGKYRLIAPLGSGAMGTVWRAEHLVLRSAVAVKVMNQRIADSTDAAARFAREAQAAAALRSPHVVSVLDSGIHDGAPFVVMELLEGESLDQRLRRVGRLSLEETSRIVTHVSRALSRANERGVVHRDLKPANVFLQRNADEELAKVLDFGVAKLDAIAQASPLTSTGAVVGSPHYMSPEQARGRREVDHRTDLWALGIIAFECVTGRRPFESDVLGDLLLKICTDPAPAPSTLAPVPAAFDAWFARAIEREPERRFQSPVEMSEALRAIVPPAAPELHAAAPAAAPTLTLAPRRSSGPSIALVLGLLTFGLAALVVVAALAAVLLLGSGGDAAPVSASSAAAAPPDATAEPAPSAAPSPSAEPPVEKPTRASKPAPATTTAPSSTSTAASGPNACVLACNKVRGCAPGAHCDSSGACTGAKRVLADCINRTPCSQVLDKCLP